MGIYEKVSEKLNQIEVKKSPELVNFLKCNRCELGTLFVFVYGSCDSYSPDPEIAMCDEKELKDCAQILLFRLQEK